MPEVIIPQDTPSPLGKHLTPTQYVDDNLMHAVMSGSSVHDITRLKLNGSLQSKLQ
jgi:hypothetical protein